MFSQNQIRNHNIATVTAAATVGRPSEVCYVKQLNEHFAFVVDPLLTPNGTTILTASGVNSFWVIVGQVNIKDNLTAIIPPVVTDDSTAGYAIGSRWVDSVAGEVYIATDVTATAAVWALVSGEDNPLASSHQNLAIAATVLAGVAHISTIPLKASAALFNASKIEVLLNGVEQVKGIDVMWLSATTFGVTVDTYVGDVITIKP